MKNLLKKELKLAASPLTWLFLVAAFMTMIPGYPILVGAFFVCFVRSEQQDGLDYRGYQGYRET